MYATGHVSTQAAMRRILICTLTAAAILLARPASALAQEGTLTSSSQRAAVLYGDSLTLSIRAEAAETLTGARVVIATGDPGTVTVEEVPITPGARIEAAHTISVENLKLPPFARLLVHWELVDQAGRLYRTDEQLVSYEDNLVPWGWRTVSAGGVTVHTDGGDGRVSQAALEISAGALSQARRTLGISQPEQIDVYVYPELAPLAASLRLHGQRVEDWVAAYADPAQRVVVVAASPGAEMLPGLQRDLPHMVTHLAVAAAAGSGNAGVPGWLNEGLALMSVGQADSALSTALDAAVRSSQLLPLADLCAPSFGELPPHQAALAYAQSESLARYVTARYGVSQVRALVAAYGTGRTCDEGIREGLGISLAQLEGQWHNDLLRQAARAPAEGGSLVPWVVVWAVSLGLALLFLAPQPGQGDDRLGQAHSGPRRVTP